VTKRVTRKGDAISFSYDRLNRVCTKTYAATAVTCGGTSGNYLASYAYDLAGRLIGANDNSASIHAAGGTASYAETLTYDALNRPLNANWTPAPSQSLPTGASVTFTHAYDATNRRIGQSATDTTWWSVPASASNVSYTTNSLNQYTAVGSVTPTYDNNGNLTYDGTFTYCYDTENRLTSVLSAGTCASPTTTVATYSYDPQGRRKSKTVSGTTTIFVTDADNREVVEYSGATGAVANWYAYGLGPNEVLNQTNGAGTTRARLRQSP
jgi:YD repeat-containing protein